MKNKMEFLKKDVIKKQFIDQNNSGLIANEEKEQKRNLEPTHKVIKGKVKVYHSNFKLNFSDSEHFDNDSELLIVSKRMLLFLKFIFTICILFSLLFMFIK